MATNEYHRLWRKNNPGRVEAARQKYRSKKENREKEKDYNRRWGKANPRNRAGYFRKWRKANPEKQKQWDKARLHTPNRRAQIRARSQNRRARLIGAGKLTTKMIQEVYEANIRRYSRLTCYLCGGSVEFGADSLDHRIPLARGGTNQVNNLEIAHRSCNSQKHILTEEEFRERQKCKP